MNGNFDPDEALRFVKARTAEAIAPNAAKISITPEGIETIERIASEMLGTREICHPVQRFMRGARSRCFLCPKTATHGACRALAPRRIQRGRGSVRPAMLGVPMTPHPFIQAKNFRRANRDPKSLLWLVLHSMEAPEKGATAENVASWFAGKHAPMASAHYCLDADSTIQCVRLEDIAFAAPGANAEGVHIELAGYARQTPEEWADPFSTAMLERCAALMAELSIECAIPLVYVDEAGLREGLCGVTTHYDVTKAFKRSTHRDPGPGFPMRALLDRATALLPPFDGYDAP